jgi:hypothetical protein
MLTRPDAVAAKEGMDTLQDPVAQSKARQVRMYLLLMRDTTNDRRPDGVLDLALAIAVTTRRVLVSFLLLDLPTLIASGL